MRHLLKLFVSVLLGAGLSACTLGSHPAALHAHARTPVPAVTATPTLSATPAPPIGPLIKHGSKGATVAQLQERLFQSAQRPYYQPNDCTFDGDFGPITAAALKSWQRANQFKPTGTINRGSSEWLLVSQQATAHRLAPSISPHLVQRLVKAGQGYAIDASQHDGCAYVLEYDATAPHQVRIVKSSQASFAGLAYDPKCSCDRQYTTPNGDFKLEYRDPAGAHAVSNAYPGQGLSHAPMPWAMCFIGSGYCFHEDPLGPSHGCIHIPSYTLAHYIYNLPLGTLVTVHE